MFERLKERRLVSRTIRRAIDTYPDGICFAAPGGRPILVNKAINNVYHALTGHTVTNADEMWEKLKEREINLLVPDAENAKESTLCMLPDGAVWQFQKALLSVRNKPITQYEASDVSELYDYQRKLWVSNQHETEIQERQRILLQNIARNNLNQELLDAKIRIHDNFGRLLIMTRSAIESTPSQPDVQTLFAAWNDVIFDLELSSQVQHHTMKSDAVKPSPQGELMRVAGLIGCQITFQGRQPTERKALLLLYAVIREALTNAVRHAGADRLTVILSEQKEHYFAEIRSNGHPASAPIQEKGGLLSLRKRLEQEGATLNYRYDGAVSLLLTIPKE